MKQAARPIVSFLSHECRVGSVESREEAFLDLKSLYMCSRRLAESTQPALVEAARHVKLSQQAYIEKVLVSYSRLLVEEEYITAEDAPEFTEEERAESLARARSLWVERRGDEDLTYEEERELADKWLDYFQSSLERRMNSPSIRWERAQYGRGGW